MLQKQLGLRLGNRVRRWWRRRKVQRISFWVLVYLVTWTGAIIMLIPFIWMISTSLKILSQVYIFPPKWIPNPVMWENYYKVLTIHPFMLWFLNSIIIVLGGVTGHVLSSSLCAYGFARLRFPGRNILFVVLLSTLMIPIYVRIVPLFILFKKYGWLNTFKPLIVPAFTGYPLYIFLLRQFYMTVPLELDDAAKIDGCSFFGLYWRIMLPLTKPALGAIAILSFMFHWKDFFCPLIYLSSDKKWPLSLGVLTYRYSGVTTGIGSALPQWNWMMGAAFLMTIPCIVVFFLFQKKFIKGIVITGVKG